MITSDELTDPFTALADATRRAILELLSAGPLAIGEIASHFPISRPAVSKHLAILRQAGLVREEQQGRARLCNLELEPLAEVERWMAGLGGVGGAAEAPVARPASRSSDDGWRVW